MSFLNVSNSSGSVSPLLSVREDLYDPFDLNSGLPREDSEGVPPSSSSSKYVAVFRSPYVPSSRSPIIHPCPLNPGEEEELESGLLERHNFRPIAPSSQNLGGSIVGESNSTSSLSDPSIQVDTPPIDESKGTQNGQNSFVELSFDQGDLFRQLQHSCIHPMKMFSMGKDRLAIARQTCLAQIGDFSTIEPPKPSANTNEAKKPSRGQSRQSIKLAKCRILSKILNEIEALPDTTILSQSSTQNVVGLVQGINGIVDWFAIAETQSARPNYLDRLANRASEKCMKILTTSFTHWKLDTTGLLKKKEYVFKPEKQKTSPNVDGPSVDGSPAKRARTSA